MLRISSFRNGFVLPQYEIMILQETNCYSQRIFPVGQPFLPDADLYLANLGQFRSRGNFLWEQVASGVVVHAVVGGHGTVLCHGKPFEAKRGDLFVFRTGANYRYFDHPSKPWKYTWLALAGTKAEACMDLLGLDVNHPCLPMPFASPFWIKLHHWCEQCQSENLGETAAEVAAWEIVGMLHEQLNRPTQHRQKALAETVRQLIETSPQTITSVNELAEAFQVSRVTLFRCFKARYDISIKAFIDQVRFGRVEHLLKNTDLPVGEVARIAGYADPFYFSRAFKKRYGVPPGLWRVTRID